MNITWHSCIQLGVSHLHVNARVVNARVVNAVNMWRSSSLCRRYSLSVKQRDSFQVTAPGGCHRLHTKKKKNRGTKLGQVPHSAVLICWVAFDLVKSLTDTVSNEENEVYFLIMCCLKCFLSGLLSDWGAWYLCEMSQNHSQFYS